MLEGIDGWPSEAIVVRYAGMEIFAANSSTVPSICDRFLTSTPFESTSLHTARLGTANELDRTIGPNFACIDALGYQNTRERS